MIVTGVIKEINLSGGSAINNKYLVEIALFKIPDDTRTQAYTYEANCSVPGGMSALYKVGDLVYVGFLNDNKSLPIILGKIYRGPDNSNQGAANLSSLAVSDAAQLPYNTVIGGYTYKDIDLLLKKVSLIDANNFSETISNITKTLSIINSRINESSGFEYRYTKEINLENQSSLEVDQNLEAGTYRFGYTEFTIQDTKAIPDDEYIADNGVDLIIVTNSGNSTKISGKNGSKISLWKKT